MSAYLQRLVTAAAGRGDAVRPRAGSIFSTPRPETPSPLQDWNTTEATTPQRQVRGASATPPERDALEPHRAAKTESAHTPLLDGTVVAATIVPAPHDTDEPLPMDEPTPVAASAAAPLIEPAADAPHVRVPTVAGPYVVTPVTERTDEAMPPHTTPRTVLDAGAPAAGRRPPRREQPAARGPREADEIQIHIGRIEVTAVPPAAPRPPRPPDRSVSLDDYLRRRGGRAK